MSCSSCHSPLLAGAAFCASCGAAVAPLQPQAIPAPADGVIDALPLPVPAVRSLEGIRGWLLLPAIGIVLAPLTTSATFLWNIGKGLTMDSLRTVLEPNASAQTFQWAVTLGVETLAYAAYTAFAVITAVFFFQRRAFAPRLMIATYLVEVGLNLMELSLVRWMELEVDAELRRDIGGAVGRALIWIPYFLSSRRVRDTFTR